MLGLTCWNPKCKGDAWRDGSATFATSYLLERTLTVLFGRKTVPMRMFRGKGCRDPRMQSSFFATDRPKNHPDRPISRLATERVVELVQICLAGESAYDRLVSGLAYEFSGVGCDAQIEEKVVFVQLDLGARGDGVRGWQAIGGSFRAIGYSVYSLLNSLRMPYAQLRL